MLGLIGTLGGSLGKTGLKGVTVSRWLSTSPYALSKIIYTECDEAPMLATYSLLPVIQRFAKPMGIEVDKLFILKAYLSCCIQFKCVERLRRGTSPWLVA